MGRATIIVELDLTGIRCRHLDDSAYMIALESMLGEVLGTDDHVQQVEIL